MGSSVIYACTAVDLFTGWAHGGYRRCDRRGRWSVEFLRQSQAQIHHC